jgi:hypothetical protein
VVTIRGETSEKTPASEKAKPEPAPAPAPAIAAAGLSNDASEPVIARWIASILGGTPPFDVGAALQDSLRSGVALCHLANRLRANVVSGRISGSALPFPQRENVTAFLAAARALGTSRLFYLLARSY